MKSFARYNPACRATARNFSRYLDGVTLTATEEKQMAVHLHDCSVCQKMRMELTAQSRLLCNIQKGEAQGMREGIIAARAVSAWASDQEKAPTPLPLWAQKRLAFGVAATVVIAGVGAGLRFAKNEPVKTTASLISPTKQNPGFERGAAKPTDDAIAPAQITPVAQVSKSDFSLKHAFAKPPTNNTWLGTVPIGSKHSHAEKVNVPNTDAKIGDDLAYINGAPTHSAAYAGRWLNLTPDETQRLQTEVEKTIQTGDRFVEVPFPRVASLGGNDAVSAAAIATYRQEREIVDARLQRKVSLSMKRISFADFCSHLETETGIHFATNKSVADDKITIFCTDRPLRDVMREIAALFNFAWQRSGEEGSYQYRLTQPLRSQLIEEELRNHDRNEALVALDKEMEKYKALTGLSPEEAKERAANATGDEKKMYENLAGVGWGPAQLYAGLSQDQLAALRDGQSLNFDATPTGPGNVTIPPNIASGILQSLGDTTRIFNGPDGSSLKIGGDATRTPGGIPPSNVPNVNAGVRLEMIANELGQFTLLGSSGFSLQQGKSAMSGMSGIDMAVGRSPSSQNPKNAEANAAIKANPELQKALRLPGREKTAPSQITTADVLEAFHKATGRDVIGDYYTRLLDSEILASASPRSLFVLLCEVSDKARLRWGNEESWLTFRSASFFNDRPKEVPNRFLERWASARQANQKILPIESLMEIAQLSDPQLNASSMAEGAKVLYGLQEWDTACSSTLKESWRLLASLPKSLQKTALKGTPVRFEQLLPAQQERFAAQVLNKSDLASVALGRISSEPSPAEKLVGATLEVNYQPMDATHPKAKIRFTYRYGTADAPSTKILEPNSTQVSNTPSTRATKGN